jgi:SAM-dependent methyltransferase
MVMDDLKPAGSKYWNARKGLLYYQAVRTLTEGLSANARSILDVGSAGCPYLDWFPHIAEKFSVDLENPYKGPGIVSARADFLEWEPGRTFDVVTCFQVLEHVPRADVFAQKLLSLGEIVVVSVPFKWPKGAAKTHVNDPVDAKKMRSWFGREPNFEFVCPELLQGYPRLIHVYERHDHKWRNLKNRASRAAAGWPAEKPPETGAPTPKKTKAAPAKVRSSPPAARPAAKTTPVGRLKTWVRRLKRKWRGASKSSLTPAPLPPIDVPQHTVRPPTAEAPPIHPKGEKMFRRVEEATCNICGGTKFRGGPNGRLSPTKKLPNCVGCRSMERHRSLHACYEGLPFGFLRWRRALQFSRDPSLQGLPFKSYEVSKYGGENHLDVQKLDRPDASYDLLVLNHVLECVPDVRAALKECMRVLSPEGILQITFARPHARDSTRDFSEPQGEDRILHLFGKDVERYFRLAELGIGCFVDREEDPVTGTPQEFHFFSRDPRQIAILQSYSDLRHKLARPVALAA